MSRFKNRGVVQYNDVNDFVNGGRTSSSWLNNWKDSGEIVVFLHPKTGFWKRVCHSMNYVVKKKDGYKIGFKPVTCWEEHSNRVATKRGMSRYCDCPIDLFQQKITDMIESNQLGLDEVVLRIGKGYDDIDRPQEVLARDLSLNHKEHHTAKSFMNSLSAAEKYVFGVVVPSELDKGVQLTQESVSLGFKFQRAIDNQCESEGEEKGNPSLNPYAFKWKYDKHTKDPSKKYDAFAYRRQELTPEIEQVIFGEGKEKELQKEIGIKAEDLILFKKMLEESLCIDLNVDEFFENVREELVGVSLDNNDEGGDVDRQSVQKSTPPSRKKAAPPSPAKKGNMLPCPHKTCGRMIEWNDKAMNCPHCGTVLAQCGYKNPDGSPCDKPLTEEGTDWKSGCIFCGGQYGDEYKQVGKQYDDELLNPSGWHSYGKKESSGQIVDDVPF